MSYVNMRFLSYNKSDYFFEKCNQRLKQNVKTVLELFAYFATAVKPHPHRPNKAICFLTLKLLIIIKLLLMRMLLFFLTFALNDAYLVMSLLLFSEGFQILIFHLSTDLHFLYVIF